MGYELGWGEVGQSQEMEYWGGGGGSEGGAQEASQVALCLDFTVCKDKCPCM